jgi:hypothetical protein|tara:strand:+ start:7026 stop:7142 length:117 start_codon:yes stop_codon:yes gene_type:complete
MGGMLVSAKSKEAHNFIYKPSKETSLWLEASVKLTEYA